MAVDVQVRALTTGSEARPRRVERLVVGEDLHPPLRRVADDLAPAGRDDGRLVHGSSLSNRRLCDHACEPLRHCGLAMVSLWCHTDAIMDLTEYVENLRRELAVAAEAGGEDARALAERLDRPARVGHPADAARRALGRRGRDHARARARLGRAAAARRRARLRRDAGAGRRAGRAGARRRRPPRCRTATRPRRRASTSGCPSSSRPASSRPPAASGCPSTPGSSAPPPPRSRATTTAARGSAAGGRPGATPAGCADSAPVRSETHARLRT